MLDYFAHGCAQPVSCTAVGLQFQIRPMRHEGNRMVSMISEVVFIFRPDTSSRAKIYAEDGSLLPRSQALLQRETLAGNSCCPLIRASRSFSILCGRNSRLELALERVVFLLLFQPKDVTYYSVSSMWGNLETTRLGCLKSFDRTFNIARTQYALPLKYAANDLRL